MLLVGRRRELEMNRTFKVRNCSILGGSNDLQSSLLVASAQDSPRDESAQDCQYRCCPRKQSSP